MLSLSTTSTTRLPAMQEEPDTDEEAVVIAAIRLHEWVETNLRRLAAGEVPLPSSEIGAPEVPSLSVRNARHLRLR